MPYFPTPPSDACLDSGPPGALFQTESESALASEDTFRRGSLLAVEEESWVELRLYEKLDGNESDTGRRDSPEEKKKKKTSHADLRFRHVYSSLDCHATTKFA